MLVVTCLSSVDQPTRGWPRRDDSSGDAPGLRRCGAARSPCAAFHPNRTDPGPTVAFRVLGPELTAAVDAEPTGTEPLFDFFERRVGLPTEFQLTTLRAVRSSEVHYPDHTLDHDAALLEMDEVGYTNDNQAIWHSVNWYTPGAMQFQLVRQRPHDS